MKERPILFSGAMVRALLDDSKTQTRRVVKWPRVPAWHNHDYDPNVVVSPNTKDAWPWASHCDGAARSIDTPLRCPYGMHGDRLWVRETWRHWPLVDETADERDGLDFRATDDIEAGEIFSWRPSIFMPRWASRITLEITDVRVQRLQDISEEDAIAEGLVAWSDPPRVTTKHYGVDLPDVWDTDPRLAYRRLWDSLNAKRGFGWSDNPWVWAISFRRIEVPRG